MDPWVPENRYAIVWEFLGPGSSVMLDGGVASGFRTASSRSTFSTACHVQFLCAWCTRTVRDALVGDTLRTVLMRLVRLSAPGPSSDMSSTCTKRELALLCPKPFTKSPMLSYHPPICLASCKAAIFISSTSTNACFEGMPPSVGGTRPNVNHRQCKFLVVRNQCLRAIAAAGRHLGCCKYQCMSFSNLFKQMWNLLRMSPRAS